MACCRRLAPPAGSCVLGPPSQHSLALLRRVHGDGCVGQQVLQLHRLNQVGVPHQPAVSQLDVLWAGRRGGWERRGVRRRAVGCRTTACGRAHTWACCTAPTLACLLRPNLPCPAAPQTQVSRRQHTKTAAATAAAAGAAYTPPLAWNDSTHSSIRSQPSASVSCVRNTAALFCMIFCMLRRIVAVVRLPLAFLRRAAGWGRRHAGVGVGMGQGAAVQAGQRQSAMFERVAHAYVHQRS